MVYKPVTQHSTSFSLDAQLVENFRQNQRFHAKVTKKRIKKKPMLSMTILVNV